MVYSYHADKVSKTIHEIINSRVKKIMTGFKHFLETRARVIKREISRTKSFIVMIFAMSVKTFL